MFLVTTRVLSPYNFSDLWLDIRVFFVMLMTNCTSKPKREVTSEAIICTTHRLYFFLLNGGFHRYFDFVVLILLKIFYAVTAV